MNPEDKAHEKIDAMLASSRWAVQRRLRVVDELESVVSANLQRPSRLRQSILEKAFSGELFMDDDSM